jgi:diguanylate cyclase (GGDEF)-like protein/PAS domain S-box-containing protein
MGKPEWPAFALAMLTAGDPERARAYAPRARSKQPQGDAGQWVRDQRLLVRFSTHRVASPPISFARILRGDPAALEAVRGRYVLIGATAAGVGPVVTTPASGAGSPMHGVEFNANALSALLDRAIVTPMPFGIALLMCAGLVMLPAFVYPRLRAREALGFCAALMLGTLALSYVFLHAANVWFAPAATVMSLAFSYPLWSWRRLDASAAALDAERTLAHATLHCIGDAVVTTDRDGRVTYLNPVAETLTNCSLAEAAGRPLQDVVDAWDETGERRVAPPIRECLEEGQVVHATRYCLLRTNMHEHAIRWSAAPIRDDHGVTSGMVLAFSDVTETLSLSRAMLRQATHDALTGLPNRLLAEDRLENAIARARRAKTQVAVVFIDLDGFKKVNDAFGHSAGDALLKEVATRLKAACRGDDTVARWGGDEFVVLLESVLRHETVVSRAAAILEVLAAALQVLGHEVYVSGSIGISMFPRDGTEVGDLFKRADAALYRAKEEGRNGFRFYSAEMTERALERVALEKSLHVALRDNQLLLYYQPQFDTRSGRIAGVEALLRWQTSAPEPLLPGRFLAVAEQSDLIHALGDWVLRTSCAQLAQFRDAGLGHLHVAVNIAPRQLQKPAFQQRIAELVREFQVEPSRLVLEITENLFLQEASGVEATLRAVRDVGVRVSIDDFGTGYSSIGYLKRLPISQVKIDKSFVRDLAQGGDDAAIVRGIVTLAHSLRLEVIAEGVENEAQLDFLKDLGCDGIQGFYLSPPLPEGKLGAHLREGFWNPSPSVSLH